LRPVAADIVSPSARKVVQGGHLDRLESQHQDKDHAGVDEYVDEEVVVMQGSLLFYDSDEPPSKGVHGDDGKARCS